MAVAVAVAVAVSGGGAVAVAVAVAGLTKRFFNHIQKDFLTNGLLSDYILIRAPANIHVRLIKRVKSMLTLV